MLKIVTPRPHIGVDRAALMVQRNGVHRIPIDWPGSQVMPSDVERDPA